jgi:cystathionine beta-lyase
LEICLMTTYNFDQYIERHNTNSAKWEMYGSDVLPMWVADMDFVSPEPVIQALRERAEHGVFGYGMPPQELFEVICQRMAHLYNWQVTPEQIVFLPGLVSGVNALCRAIGQPGDGVLLQTPVYYPFLTAIANQGRTLQAAELSLKTNGQTLEYEIDFDVFESTIEAHTRLFILCNPHNPIGRGYTRREQTRMAEICAEHNLVICSDEIHSDLLLNGTQHLPLATISPEIADRTITLIAPSKTYNLPGLGCSIAIIQNDELRQQLNQAAAGIVPGVNVMGYAAALAAYTKGNEWLEQLLSYLSANRQTVVDYVNKCLPGIKTTAPAATYLAWLNCREAGIEGNPHKFFLEKAKVALNDGAVFGPGGEGFVRLNFGCPRSTLMQGLEQMRQALKNL